MAVGFQSNPGQASRIFFSNANYGYEPARSMAVDSEGVAQAKLQGQQQKDRQADQNAFAGQQAGADRMLTEAEGDRNRANQLATVNAPLNYKREVLGQVSPLLQNLMGSAQSGMVGGQNTPQPQITAAPVWSQQQIDQQVNSQKANNATAAASQSKAAEARVTGSGFGSRSPLLAALQGGIQAQRMGADATAQRETNWNAAQGNAKQLLAGQQAQEGQWNDYNQADIERRKANNQYTTSLAGILAGML